MALVLCSQSQPGWGRRGDAVFSLGLVNVGVFVAELSHIGKDQKAVNEAFGDVEYLLVVGAQGHAHPLAVGDGAGAAVYGSSVHFAHGDADQFALGMLLLEVQALEDTFCSAALVILDEWLVDAR